MRTVAIDDSGCLSVTLSICLACGLTRFRCAKTAEQIKVLFGMKTLGGPENIALDESSYSSTTRGA